jgi:hypothetical protein
MQEDNVTNFVLPGFDDVPFHPWTTISKFSEIDIKPNTIIFCDIDDTLLHHPFLNGDWTTMLNVFFNMKHHAETGEYNCVESTKAMEAYIDTVLAERPMLHCDREGFFKMVDLGKRFLFVTARFPSAIEFTYQNLRSIDVDPENFEVRFSGREDKGAYIRREFGEIIQGYDSVVFIDDQPRNLENVYSAIEHPGLKLYRFQRVFKEDPYVYYPLPPNFIPHLQFDGQQLVDTRCQPQDSSLGLDIDSESDDDTI